MLLGPASQTGSGCSLAHGATFSPCTWYRWFQEPFNSRSHFIGWTTLFPPPRPHHSRNLLEEVSRSSLNSPTPIPFAVQFLQLLLIQGSCHLSLLSLPP